MAYAAFLGMMLTVVIPVFNERRFVRQVVDEVSRQRIAGIDQMEIVLVDDCSTDGTTQIVQALQREHPETLRLVLHKRNRGKGAALRSGFTEAKGDIIIVQDADLEYEPSQYAVLLRPILGGRADVVFGSRFMASQEKRVLYFWHMVGNRFLTLLSNVLTNINLTDMETGYKAFRKDVLQSVTIQENRFGFEPEITAKVAKLRCRIYEVGIAYHGRTYAEGKKIGWRDGLWALCCILKYNVLSVGPHVHWAPAAQESTAPESTAPAFAELSMTDGVNQKRRPDLPVTSL